MTFPPGFIYDPNALAEFRRILDSNGQLIWVDAGRLLPCDVWSRTLQRSVDLIEGAPGFAEVAIKTLSSAGFESRIEVVRDDASVVNVVIAKKIL
jgi:hypothetical protein